MDMTNDGSGGSVDSTVGVRKAVSEALPKGGRSVSDGWRHLVVLDASGIPAAGLPVLGPLSGNLVEFAGVWASMFDRATKTDEAGVWMPNGGGNANPGTYAVLMAPHVCVLAPIDDRRQLVLPETYELTLVPSGFGAGEQWRCIVQPDYGEHPFAEVVMAGGVRVLLRELVLRGASEMQTFPIGPRNSEWSLDVSTTRVPAVLSRSRVALPASVEVSRVWRDDRATLLIVDANRNPLSVGGVVRVAKEPNQPLATLNLQDGALSFDEDMFSQGERYLLDVVLVTGDVVGPIHYDPARDSSRIIAVVDPDGAGVLSIACDARAATGSVLVEDGGGFHHISRLDQSSAGEAWFDQRAPGVVAVFLSGSHSDCRVIWLVSKSGEVGIASLEIRGAPIEAKTEGVAKATIAPATFGMDAWPKGLVGLEVDLIGALSGKREVVPVAAVLTSVAESGLGPFLRLTGSRAQSYGLLKPRGRERLRVLLDK